MYLSSHPIIDNGAIEGELHPSNAAAFGFVIMHEQLTTHADIVVDQGQSVQAYNFEQFGIRVRVNAHSEYFLVTANFYRITYES